MKGIVIGRNLDGAAWVRITPEQSCHGDDCALESDCQEKEEPNPLRMFAFLDRSGPGWVKARNLAGARLGQKCDLVWEHGKDQARAAYWLYLIPATLFLIGMSLGASIAQQSGVVGDSQIGISLLGGIASLFAGFCAAKRMGLRKRAVPLVIQRVINPDQKKRRLWLSNWESRTKAQIQPFLGRR